MLDTEQLTFRVNAHDDFGVKEIGMRWEGPEQGIVEARAGLEAMPGERQGRTRLDVVPPPLGRGDPGQHRAGTVAERRTRRAIETSECVDAANFVVGDRAKAYAPHRSRQS